MACCGPLGVILVKLLRLRNLVRDFAALRTSRDSILVPLVLLSLA